MQRVMGGMSLIHRESGPETALMADSCYGEVYALSNAK
ncbi:hypothetical protein PATSB16_04650 [Pandoraea thiooxydans]|nr:hypothetical protein PATSB16_04650 [Pandoraea thiooxydans]